MYTYIISKSILFISRIYKYKYKYKHIMDQIINLDKTIKNSNIDIHHLNDSFLIDEKKGSEVVSITGKGGIHGDNNRYINLPKRNKKKNDFKLKGRKKRTMRTMRKKRVKYISSDSDDDSDFINDPIDLNMRSYKKFKFRTKKNKRKDMYLNALKSFESRGSADGYRFNDNTSLNDLKTMYEEIAIDEKNKTKYQLFKFIISSLVWGSEWILKRVKIINPSRVDGWSTLFSKNIEGIKPYFDDMVRDVEEYDEETGQVMMVSNPSFVNKIPANPTFGLFAYIIRSFTMFYVMRDIHGLAEYITKNDNKNMENMLKRKK